MATPSNRGENGHLAMEESTRARAGVCPTHGVVTPVVVGGRWKCPVCGTFIRKQGSTSLAAFPRAVERSADEMLWRLEVHHTLLAIAARLSGLPEDVQTLVAFGAVMDWIEWADAGHMTIPATELEKAVQRIVDRAAELDGAPQLFRNLSTLEEEFARRAEERDRLRSEGAALKDTVGRWETRARKLENWLKAVEGKSGMSSAEILRHLQNFSAVLRETERLSQAKNQLNRDCWSAHAQLGQLQGEIYRGQHEVRRLRQLEGESWDKVADKLTTRELLDLLDRKQETRLKDLQRRAMIRTSSGYM